MCSLTTWSFLCLPPPVTRPPSQRQSSPYTSYTLKTVLRFLQPAGIKHRYKSSDISFPIEMEVVCVSPLPCVHDFNERRTNRQSNGANTCDTTHGRQRRSHRLSHHRRAGWVTTLVSSTMPWSWEDCREKFGPVIKETNIYIFKVK